nr:PREDICTED: major royal jelly protein 1-like [Megachile rotundata]
MRTSWLTLLCFGGISLDDTLAFSKKDTMKVIREWKYIDYSYPTKEQKESAIKSGEYNHSNCFPIDVDQWHEKTFVTVIRDVGVPSSLNVVSKKVGDGGPLLLPYPNWSWTKTDTCDGIISVYRVAIDRCDRLWVIDNGIIGSNRICPAKLLAFHLPTSRLLEKVTIPDKVARNSTTGNGLLITPIVETYGQRCEITKVYISDVEGYGIIVYDGLAFRRLTSAAVVYDPKATNYTIKGQSFALKDGPVGMAFSPFTKNLYYSPMSSYDMNILHTRSVFAPGHSNYRFSENKHILPTQASAKAMSSSGILFFGLVNSTSIGCWNESKLLKRKNFDFVAVNDQTLQFTSGMKVKNRRGREELWALSNRYQKIATGTMNFEEVNFRILTGHVNRLIEGTLCQAKY